MTNFIDASASPEKNLFISLLTRDIPLVAALLDLIDNSINSAVEPFSNKLKTAQDYADAAVDDTIQSDVNIMVNFNQDVVSVVDTASGIDTQTARDHIFKFGRAEGEVHANDRLSVYGIGLKRAIFKIGNKISIVSDHVNGGFELDLDVAKWAKETELPWVLKIVKRSPVTPERTGTKIVIAELYDETKRRIADGFFEAELKERIGKTYSFYLGRFVDIDVNDESVAGHDINISQNRNSNEIEIGEVSCLIMAGIGTPKNDRFIGEDAGWFVFCNGRAVVFADQSSLSGWGVTLPIFQPKHRPFLGLVFFVSDNAERLPWDTTKSRINQDSTVWQVAKRSMATIGRSVISFLDKRYTEDGTEVSPEEMSEVGKERINPLQASASTITKFAAPKAKPPSNVNIGYSAKIADVERIKKYLGKPGMSGSAIGRYTFRHFLTNEVDD